MTSAEPIPAGPGQESVWDYTRPPRLEPAQARVLVVLAHEVVPESTSAYRVLETSHPPSYYLPLEDCLQELLEPARSGSFGEWTGSAVYETVRVDSALAERAAWHYPDPSPGFEAIAEHRSLCPALVDCSVDGEPVIPQPGRSYGGWITPDVMGPFKGEPGTQYW